MRYVRAQIENPKMFWGDDPPLIPNLTVDNHECVETGLIWKDGTPIMRAPYPIGYGRDDEWV